jgi:hypothetical protein
MNRRLVLATLAFLLLPPMAMADSVADRKAAFLKTVDESISGARIAGNPWKFVGKHVDLHCSVGPIIDEHTFNGVCGDAFGDAIAIVCNSTKSLEAGQDVRVLGIVQNPLDGTNTNGGAQKWGVVKAVFME